MTFKLNALERKKGSECSAKLFCVVDRSRISNEECDSSQPKRAISDWPANLFFVLFGRILALKADLLAVSYCNLLLSKAVFFGNTEVFRWTRKGTVRISPSVPNCSNRTRKASREPPKHWNFLKAQWSNGIRVCGWPAFVYFWSRNFRKHVHVFISSIYFRLYSRLNTIQILFNEWYSAYC